MSKALSPGPGCGPNGAVLVTGCASGIGRACAVSLTSKGVRVFAGVRQERDCAILAELGVENLVPLALDITSDEQIRAAASFIQRDLAGERLAGVVNNAGICITGPLEYISREQLRHQLEVNVVSQIAVVQAFLPMLRQSQGRIVNIGSVSGHISGALFGPYCASKFALEAVTKALRAELSSSGVSVSIVDPGSVATALWEKTMAMQDELAQSIPTPGKMLYGTQLSSRREQMGRMKEFARSADAVCDAVQRALTSRRPRERYIVGIEAKVKIGLAKIVPEFIWALMARGRRGYASAK
jgi:NAD(P)-dependent dehydrogenase (short-subunit alcohol dehydrogenase family)